MTEAAAPAEVPATPVAPAPVEVPADPVAATEPTDARADTVEWLEQLTAEPEGGKAAPAEAPAPAPAPPAEAPAAPAAPEFQLPDLTAITATAKERSAARKAQESADAPMRERLATMDDKIAQLTALIEQATPKPTAPPLPPEQQLMADAFEQRLAPLQALLEQATAAPTPAAAPDLGDAQAQFGAYVGGAADRYPRLSALPEQYRGAAAWTYVTQMRAAGMDTTQLSDEQIATEVERSLAPPGAPFAAQGGTPLAPPGTAPAANGGPTNPSAPRSITAGSAADGARRAPETDQECHDDAVAWLKARQG